MSDHKMVLVRQFRMGATVLADVNPAWSTEQVLAAYVPNFPFLANATLSEPTVEGEFLVFQIIKPAIQTKGHAADRHAVENALARIGAWSDAPVADPLACSAWVPVLELIERRLDHDAMSSGCLDPFLIPLA